MSDEQEAKRVENEPEAEKELTSEELDQVVGGTDPKPKPTTTQPQTYIVVTMNNTLISGYQ